MSKLGILRNFDNSQPSGESKGSPDVFEELAEMRQLLEALPRAIANQQGDSLDRLDQASSAASQSTTVLNKRLKALHDAQGPLVRRVEQSVGNLPQRVEDLAAMVEEENAARDTLNQRLGTVSHQLSKHVMRIEVVLWTAVVMLVIGVGLGALGMKHFLQPDLNDGVEWKNNSNYLRRLWRNATPEERDALRNMHARKRAPE